MNIKTVWNLIAVAVACSASSARCDPTLKLTKGAIEGRVLTSRDGRPYHSYTGVPYAKPPVGELRFKVRLTVINTAGRLAFIWDPECM